MKILITAAATRLSQELAASLSIKHQIRLTDRRHVPTKLEFVRSELGHDAGPNLLVRGMDVIIHSGEVPSDVSLSEQLDIAMRCTYNLLWAAAEERVPRVVFLSSLRVMDRYSEDLAVTERWRPVPTTELPVLCYHLGEYTCREFAREKKLMVVCLRLGELVWDAGPTDAVPTSGLYLDDAAQAVDRALSVEVSHGWTNIKSAWNIFHIQSTVPNQRYLTRTAQEVLGYKPLQVS